jgi:hypothetical protein
MANLVTVSQRWPAMKCHPERSRGIPRRYLTSRDPSTPLRSAQDDGLWFTLCGGLFSIYFRSLIVTTAQLYTVAYGKFAVGAAITWLN